jgi:hypothetical protein
MRLASMAASPNSMQGLQKEEYNNNKAVTTLNFF